MLQRPTLVNSAAVAGFAGPDRLPGVPGDLEDHERDREADDRVGALGVRARRRRRWRRRRGRRSRRRGRGCRRRPAPGCASRRPARSRTWAAISLPAKPITPGGGEHPEMGRCCGWIKPLDRLVERDAGADEDRGDDERARRASRRGRAEEEGDPERDRGECVAEVVDQVGEQRDAAGGKEDRGLRKRRDEKDCERDRNGLDALVRANDRSVNKPVRMTVTVIAI